MSWLPITEPKPVMFRCLACGELLEAELVVTERAGENQLAYSIEASCCEDFQPVRVKEELL